MGSAGTPSHQQADSLASDVRSTRIHPVLRELEVAFLVPFGRGSLYPWRTQLFVESEWALRSEITDVGSGKPLEALFNGILRHYVAEKRSEQLAPQVGISGGGQIVACLRISLVSKSSLRLGRLLLSFRDQHHSGPVELFGTRPSCA